MNKVEIKRQSLKTSRFPYLSANFLDKVMPQNHENDAPCIKQAESGRNRVFAENIQANTRKRLNDRSNEYGETFLINIIFEIVNI